MVTFLGIVARRMVIIFGMGGDFFTQDFMGFVALAGRVGSQTATANGNNITFKGGDINRAGSRVEDVSHDN